MHRSSSGLAWAGVVLAFAASACNTGPTELRPQRASPWAELSKQSSGACVYFPSRVVGSGGALAPRFEVECPPDLGGPPIGPRPKGRESWLRTRPWLQLRWEHNQPNNCRLYGETLCPRAPIEAACEAGPVREGVPCSAIDANAGAETKLHVEAFVWTDATGRCHRVAAFDCAPGCLVPDGDLVECAR